MLDERYTPKRLVVATVLGFLASLLLVVVFVALANVGANKSSQQFVLGGSIVLLGVSTSVFATAMVRENYLRSQKGDSAFRIIGDRTGLAGAGQYFKSQTWNSIFLIFGLGFVLVGFKVLIT